MSAHQHAAPAPVGGKLFNTATVVCGVLIAAMIAVLFVRFMFGLGAVTNLNDGYRWFARPCWPACSATRWPVSG